MIVLLMGVSGAGKTTLGERLAKRLAWPFIDADDYHPAANVAKMAAGMALDDEDRWPWLDALNRRLRAERDAVLACASKRSPGLFLEQLKRSRARQRIAGRARAELAVAVLDVARNRVCRDAKALAHLLVGASLGEKPQHVALALA